MDTVMSEPLRILVALDFSSCCWEVAKEAADRAQELGAWTTLLHVEVLPNGVPDSARVRIEGQRTTAARYLHRGAEERLRGYEKVFRDQKLPVKVELRRGSDIAATVVEAARDHRSNVIFMGTHRRKGLAKLMNGSVAERVQRSAPCEVVAIPTRHLPECEAKSCEWCDSHITPEQRRLDAEAEG